MAAFYGVSYAFPIKGCRWVYVHSEDMDHDEEDGEYGIGILDLEGGEGDNLGVSEREEDNEQGLPEVEVGAEAEPEGEAEDEDEYSLLFEGEMDPLRFAEEDENGKLPYEQFQRLEYEALAARKRKNLAARRYVLVSYHAMLSFLDVAENSDPEDSLPEVWRVL